MTKRYILTGAPGAGKTTLIRQLERGGASVVEEAATDIIALEQARGIATPWTEPWFTAEIARLQNLRLASATQITPDRQFHDRSVFCTYALARFIGHPVPPVLESAVRQAIADGTFMRKVFFVRLLDFIKPTEARQIGFDEAVHFERVHEEVYESFGFELVPIERGSIEDRVNAILTLI